MRPLILLISAGVLMAAEAPKPTPPKTAQLSEVEQLKIENIQLRLQLIKATESELNTALNAVFSAKCQSLGGATMADCTASGPTQAQPGYSVTLKPVAPVTAKVEAKK